jgi:hypothetical protein
VPPGGGKHLEEASGQGMSMKLFGRHLSAVIRRLGCVQRPYLKAF